MGKELVGLGKKPLAPQEEAVKLVSDILALISVKYFDFTMREVVSVLLKPAEKDPRSVELLGVERFMMGLRAIHSIYFRVIGGRAWEGEEGGREQGWGRRRIQPQRSSVIEL